MSTRPTWSPSWPDWIRPQRFHRRIEDVLDAGDVDQRDGGTSLAGRCAGRGCGVKHFVAVSTNAKLVEAFGIDTANMFGFWDWVGGRYSVDSAIGLSVMAVIGRERFGEFLAGFHLIDEHFRTLPGQRPGTARPDRTLVLELLRRTVTCGAAVLERPGPLRGVPAAADDGVQRQVGARRRLARHSDTGEIFWGEPGTNGQHAFYQLLHQGTRLVPADFIGFSQPVDDLATADGTGMHDLLMSNFFAQTRCWRSARRPRRSPGTSSGEPANVLPHKVMPGNRPSTSILATRLTPSVVGQLIALYEHQVFTQGVIWGIDSFDQWGVELGKKLGDRAATGHHRR
jgi:glucose-6-phosphate isomerase